MSPFTPQASFQIGSMTFYFYGLLITTGILLGYLLAIKRARIYGIPVSEIENLFLLTVPSAIMGARLYHVIESWEYYSTDLKQIFNVRGGGLAIHGGIFASILVFFIYSRIRKINLLALLDLCAPSLALGQAIGRWGNFFNQELYGSPTSLPWKIFIDPVHRIPGYYSSAYYHPTFLYESLLNAGICLGLLFLADKWKKKSRGRILFFYLIGYGVVRFLMECIRIDEPATIGPLKLAQAVSLLLITAGTLGIYLVSKQAGRKKPAENSSTPTSTK